MGIINIDAGSKIPLYLQLEEIIKQTIETGIYKVGDMIPNETELQKKYQVSRATVRKAIEDLTLEGLLVKKQGKGTFVCTPKVTQNLNLITSFGETLLAMGYSPKAKVIEMAEIKAPQKVAEALGLEPETKVKYIHRIYIANDEPIAIILNYLAPSVIPDISLDDLCKHSLYHLLENKYGIILDSAIEVIEAKNASESEAKELNVAKNLALIQTVRITYSPNGSPIEYVVVKSRGDKYSYSIRLSGRKK
ncbi:MAG: GntR family transcriptional regulator [Bacteroidota bacterium]